MSVDDWWTVAAVCGCVAVGAALPDVPALLRWAAAFYRAGFGRRRRGPGGESRDSLPGAGGPGRGGGG